MEFCIPWQRWNIPDIQYGLSQTNTRIENGLFVPIYYSDKNVKCQAVHLLAPAFTVQGIDATKNGTFLVIKVPAKAEFASKLLDFETRNLNLATKNQHAWWPNKTSLSYKTALTTLQNGDLEWRIQIPDSGIYSCFDSVRKSWYASNESGLARRECRVLARTSGLWIDHSAFGMEWKLIGAFIV